VQLTQGRVFKCDPEDLHIVEEYVWGVSGGYVTTKHGPFTLSFNNLVMNHRPTKRLAVDHIDRNPLNCCKSNLRLVDRRTQSINCSIGKNNTLGVVGVSYDRRKDCWVATWNCDYGSSNAQVFTVYRYGFDYKYYMYSGSISRVERAGGKQNYLSFLYRTDMKQTKLSLFSI